MSRIHYISIVCVLCGNSNRATTSDIITSTYLFEMSFSVWYSTTSIDRHHNTFNANANIPAFSHAVHSNKVQDVNSSNMFGIHSPAVTKWNRVSSAHFNNKPLFNSVCVYLKYTLELTNKRKAVNFHWINTCGIPYWWPFFASVFVCLGYISIRFGVCVCAAADAFLLLFLDLISLYNIEVKGRRNSDRAGE